MIRSRKDLLDEIQDLDIETFDLIAKVIELINIIGWDDDDCYTFKNGEKWYRFDPDLEIQRRSAENE